MGILIENRQSVHKMPLKTITRKAQAILNGLDCPDGELSILIVDDSQIADLNSQYLKREGPTNVIAFPMREGDHSDITPNLLGDVVISADTALREGKTAGMSLEKRLIQLLVHGILHLLGYDHEKTDAEAERMVKKSEQILKTIGYAE